MKARNAALIICIILLVPIVLSQTEECDNDRLSVECKESLIKLANENPQDFENALSTNPSIASNYPEAYSAAISRDPSISARYPEAYETAILRHPEIISANPNAFADYTAQRGIPGDISPQKGIPPAQISYTAGGVFRIEVSPPIEFRLEDLRNTGATGFTVSPEGTLILTYPAEAGAQQAVITYGSVNSNGMWTGGLEFYKENSIIRVEGRFTLSNGRLFLEPASFIDADINGDGTDDMSVHVSQRTVVQEQRCLNANENCVGIFPVSQTERGLSLSGSGISLDINLGNNGLPTYRFAQLEVLRSDITDISITESLPDGTTNFQIGFRGDRYEILNGNMPSSFGQIAYGHDNIFRTEDGWTYAICSDCRVIGINRALPEVQEIGTLTNQRFIVGGDGQPIGDVLVYNNNGRQTAICIANPGTSLPVVSATPSSTPPSGFGCSINGQMFGARSNSAAARNLGGYSSADILVYDGTAYYPVKDEEGTTTDSTQNINQGSVPRWGTGFFYVTQDGTSAVQRIINLNRQTDRNSVSNFLANSNINFGVQGTILVENGEIPQRNGVPEFEAFSWTLDHRPRSGIGVLPDGRVFMIATEERVSLQQFAQIGRDAMGGQGTFINLDGGGSTGLSAGGQYIVTKSDDRTVPFWLAFVDSGQGSAYGYTPESTITHNTAP